MVSRRTKRRHELERKYFPSPAEVSFARLMGAWVIRIPFVRCWWRASGYRYPLAFILPAGWYRNTFIEREIEVRGYWIDFGNRTARRGIEIDSRDHDIIADQERDDNLAKSGWKILRIPACEVLPDNISFVPNRVRRRAREFLD